MSRTSSYLYMGASIQIAYSLGLHRDQAPESASSMDREQNRRIWWTLFMLDLEIASRGGSPTLIDERHLKITTPLPSEQVSAESMRAYSSELTLDRYCTLGCIHRLLGRQHRYLYAGSRGKSSKQYTQSAPRTRALYPSQPYPTYSSPCRSGSN